MDSFTMWQESITFKDGWFLYSDGKGNNSIISHKRARDMERGFQRYQAGMDINRGGLPDEIAYPSRGFTYKNGEYVYENYRVDTLIKGKAATIGECMKIPEKVGGSLINSVADEAFRDNTNIKRVILHKGIKMIGKNAFCGCTNLKDISVANDHLIINKDAFKDTAFFKDKGILYLNNTLIKVSPQYDGVLEIKEGITAIADNALFNCDRITEVILHKGLISVGNYSFHGCSALRRIELPDTVNTIGDNAFEKCTALKAIAFPKRMERMGFCAFAECTSLTSVSLPEGIPEIERAVFIHCKNLKEINIPKSVKRIWFNAFEDTFLFNEFKQSDLSELYIGEWLIAYKKESVKNLCVREGTVGIAGMSSWEKAPELIGIDLPKSLKFIGEYAFAYSPLEKAELPCNLEYIDTAAFRSSALKSVVIPKSVKTVNEWAFMDCESIESITIEGRDTEIIWPAITGRRDKKPIVISAPILSKAREYCRAYGQKNNLVF